MTSPVPAGMLEMAPDAVIGVPPMARSWLMGVEIAAPVMVAFTRTTSLSLSGKLMETVPAVQSGQDLETGLGAQATRTIPSSPAIRSFIRGSRRRQRRERRAKNMLSVKVQVKLSLA